MKHDKILSNTYTKFDYILLITSKAIEQKWNLNCNQGQLLSKVNKNICLMVFT